MGKDNFTVNHSRTKKRCLLSIVEGHLMFLEMAITEGSLHIHHPWMIGRVLRCCHIYCGQRCIDDKRNRLRLENKGRSCTFCRNL